MPVSVKKKVVAKKDIVEKSRGTNMKLQTPSADLAAVIGSTPVPRTQVTKLLWDYIKKHKLQDSVNKRNINADASLKKVFDGKSVVSMFDLPKHISKHLT